MDNDLARDWQKLEEYALARNGVLRRSDDRFLYELQNGAIWLWADTSGFHCVIRRTIIPRFTARYAVYRGVEDRNRWRIDDNKHSRYEVIAAGEVADYLTEIASRENVIASVEVTSGDERLRGVFTDSFCINPLRARQTRSIGFAVRTLPELVDLLELVMTSTHSWSQLNEWDLPERGVAVEVPA